MVVLEDTRVYISRRQNTISQCIATRPIMDLCLEAERTPGMRLSRKWWEQPSLDIMGIRAGQVAGEGKEEAWGGGLILVVGRSRVG